MNSLVRLVTIVVYVFVLFEEDTAIHIDLSNLSLSGDAQVKHEILQPIEHGLGNEETLKSDQTQIESNEEIISYNQLPEIPEKEFKTEEVKNRVVRQVKGTYYYGNNQYYNPGQGTHSSSPQWDRNTSFNGYNNSLSQNPLANTTFNGYSPAAYPSSQNTNYNNPGSAYYTPQGPPYNSQWDRNSNRNTSFSSNPLANVTFNGYPSGSYPSTQNTYNNNPGSSYNLPRPSQQPQWDTKQNYNRSNPYNGFNGYNNSFSSNSLANATFSGYPSSPHLLYNGSRPSQQNYFSSTSPRYSTYPSYSSKIPSQSYSNHPSTTMSPYYASVRPGSSDWRNYSRPSQNFYGNNSTYRHPSNQSRPGYPNPYEYTSPRYPTNSNYPRNNSTHNAGHGQSYSNYNPSYPSPSPFNSSVTKPSDYGQANSYGNIPRPNNAENLYNHSYSYGYNNNSHPGKQYENNNYSANASIPSYNNFSPRPSYGGYPSSYNNGQGQNNRNPVQPYSPNGPYDTLFNYPTKHNSTEYDPRKNPSHQFSY